MHKNTKLRLGAVASLAVAVMAFGALPAQADPVTPPFPVLAGAGSDTTQDVVAGVATLAPTVIGSWDATGGGSIQTKAGAPNPVVFQRPNGSGDGVFALGQSAQGLQYNGVNIAGQLDFARSSSDPSGSTGVLTYVPFALDAVTIAFNGASSFPTDLPVGTAATDTGPAGFKFNLRNIYQCRVTTFPDAGGNDVTIVPLIPQGGSGTRSFWLKQMGLTETSLGTTHTCVTSRNDAVQEHDGRSLTGLGDIMPYSIAQYIAQGRHSQITTTPVVERRGNAVLGKLGTKNPFTLSGGVLTLNPNFPIKRTVYNVVQTSRLGETAIANTFVGASSTFCSTAGQNVIKSYGFAVAPDCGVTTITGAFRTGP